MTVYAVVSPGNAYGGVHSRPMRLLALPLLLTLGCAPAAQPDPAAKAYADALQPLVQENGLVAERVLEVAADVYNGKAVSADTRKVWRDELAPMAEHLRNQAALVQAPPEWSADHTELVTIWTLRSDAWQDISEALEAGDPDLWKTGRSRSDEAKLQEESWFRKTNERLASQGITLDQFP